MSKRRQIKPYFRRHKVDGHKMLIYGETRDGKDYKYVNFTHANFTRGLKNIKLKFNIDSNDKEPCYVRPFTTHDSKSNFKKKKLKRLRVHKADKKIIRKVKRNYIV